MNWSVLIANRGEIAVRVIRACRDLGLRAVAVYSPVDRRAPHVALADAAYSLPGDSPAESYLHTAALLEVARHAGAHAVHPGYGFLAENAAFAAACAAAGLTFVGPPPGVLKVCGDKARTRERLAASGVPVLPGTGPVGDQEMAAAASRLGFPLLIKAAGGGGGKGIHLVRTPDELLGVARLARGEARAAFGDDRIYLERWVPGARHVEVQVLGDGTGQVVALGERECSVQRRHQKLIEESPAPGLDPLLRARMLEAAVAGARAIGYVNAGTFEFLVDGAAFYFLEVNARLQVEHPVTELVTGCDLVVEQLRIAQGMPSAIDPERLSLSGHAIECRISAEDPHEGFLPSTGQIEAVIEPAGPGIRVDSGLYAGMEVTRHYDPLLAKVIAWAPSRSEAITRMRRALGEMAVAGIATTIPFHLWALAQSTFVDGRYDTRFVSRWEERSAGNSREQVAVMAAAAVAFLGATRMTFPTVPPGGRWLRAAREEGLGDE